MEKRTILNCPARFDKSDFLSLVSLSAGAVIARQNALGELVIKNEGWNVDVKNGTISFGKSVFPAGMIGTESALSGTWLWGRANKQSGLPERAAAPSRRAAKLLPDCPEFAAESFLLDELHNGHNISMVCCAASEGNVCYYRCPYDGGALFVQISELPEEVFRPQDAAGFMRSYLEIIQGMYCDHRLLAEGAAWLEGYDFSEEDTAVTVRIGSETLRFAFEEADGLSRVTDIHTV